MIEPDNLKIELPRTKRPWVLWALFFFQFAAIGIYFTFLNVYYRQAGLSGTQIGLINMTTALIGVACAILWGYISDRTGKPRLLIAIGAAGALVVAQFIPTVHTFSAFLALGALASLFGSAGGTLVDSTTLVILGERREDYGRFRMAGSVGYIITTILAGFLFDRLGMRVMFPAYGLMMGMFALIALMLPAIPVRRAARGRSDVGQMVRQPAWILFTACIFLVWIASNASISFIGVSLEAMGASKTLISLAVVVGAVIEIPFMAYSGRLLRRFGPAKLLILSMSLSFVRYLLLGWMNAPGWAVAINLINGPAFVLFWNSAVNLANRLAPEGMAGTAQGMLSSTMSLAGVVSALLTGWLFDLLGPTHLFWVMAVSVLLALILFSVGQLRLREASHIVQEKAGVP